MEWPYGLFRSSFAGRSRPVFDLSLYPIRLAMAHRLWGRTIPGACPLRTWRRMVLVALFCSVWGAEPLGLWPFPLPQKAGDGSPPVGSHHPWRLPVENMAPGGSRRTLLLRVGRGAAQPAVRAVGLPTLQLGSPPRGRLRPRRPRLPLLPLGSALGGRRRLQKRCAGSGRQVGRRARNSKERRAVRRRTGLPTRSATRVENDPDRMVGW